MTQIITTSSTVAGVNITALANETIFVAEGVTVAASTNTALRSTLGGANIQILGTLFGVLDGMDLSDSADANGLFDVTIGITGKVIGTSYGIRMTDNNNTLTNLGQISATNLSGVYNNGGSSMDVVNAGTISSSASYGVGNFLGSAFNLINSGTIFSSNSNGVNNSAGTSFSLNNSGTISSSASYGVYNNNGAAFNLINSGTISSSNSYGVYNVGGSSFTLNNSGTISSGDSYGVYNNTGFGFSLSNSGTISSSDSTGVYNNNGSDFSLSNSGTISSGTGVGVHNLDGANFSLTNSGTISSGGNDTVISTGSGGSVINYGLIESTGVSALDNAVSIRDNDFNVAVTLTNYGTLSAAGGIAVYGDIGDVDEVHNFGTIIGDIFNSSGNDLVENSGLINGDVLLGEGNDAYDGAGGRVTGTVLGDAGNDTLTGGDLADRLDGGSNNDTLTGGKGADILTGGTGTDMASYATSLGGVQINLQTGAASSYDAAGDVLTTIENLTGSSGADYLAGDLNVNVLDGGAGDDSLYGRVGADTLTGGAGDDRLFGGMDVDILNGGDDDDVLIGGAGGDTIDGGNGIDTADYSASLAAVTMNLQTNVHSGGDAAGDSLANIERVIGTSFADDIAGSFGDNVMIAGDGVDRLQGRLGLDDLYGGGGNDRLFGGVDNDRLFGGTGNDMLYGGNDNDLFIMENSFGNDRIMDFTNGSEFVDVSAVTGATTATLNVTGGGASNVMVDFGGLDTIEFVGITNVALITEADFIF